MKKALVFNFLVIFSVAVAGLYGVLHDQLTYAISPEYYAKFKFIQFELIEEGQAVNPENARLLVVAVGFLATWWMGIPIGVILSLVGLMHNGWKRMLKTTIKAFGVTMIVAFAVGLLGLAYGYFYLSHFPIELFRRKGWFIPEHLIDHEHFIMVGSMHNFSYIGGLAGLIGGVLYSIKVKRKAYRNTKV